MTENGAAGRAAEAAGNGAGTAGPFSGGGGAAVLLPLLIYAVLVFLFRGFVIDDSYITYRYADNIVRGGAPSFNADDETPVEGYTSFLWVALSAAAIRAGIDPLAATRTVGVAAGGGAILLLFLLARDLFGRRPAALLPPLALALSAEHAEWSVSGMETAFFLFLFLLALRFLLRELKEGGFARSSLLFGALAATRPEGAILFGVALLFRTGAALREGSGVKKSLRRGGAALLPFLAVYLPYYAWRLATYRLPFPNSYYAKRIAHAGAPHLGEWALYLGPVLLLAAAALLPFAARRSGHGRPLLLWLMTLTAVPVLWNIIPVMAWDWRLLLHLHPLLFLLAAAPVAALAAGGGRARRIAAAALAALLLLWTAHPERLEGRIDRARRTGRGIRAAHIRTGLWIKKSYPPDTVIALIDTGAIPYVTRMRAIDIANIPLNNRRLAAGRYTLADFWNDEPDLIVVREDEEGRLAAHPVREVLVRDALRRGFRRIRHAKYDENYYLVVLADPLNNPRERRR